MKTNTDYAINKNNPNAIVYRFNDDEETIVYLTKEDFASEEEFLKWKKISDENLHEIEKGENYFDKKTCSLEAAAFDGDAPAREDSYFYKEEKEEEAKKMAELNERVHKAMSHCTEIQQRRLWAVSKGMSSYEIAKIENCDHKAILKSVKGAKKIFLKKF